MKKSPCLKKAMFAPSISMYLETVNPSMLQYHSTDDFSSGTLIPQWWGSKSAGEFMESSFLYWLAIAQAVVTKGSTSGCDASKNALEHLREAGSDSPSQPPTRR